MAADGSYLYDPNGAFDTLGAGQTATDSFSYTVADGFGGTAVGQATITITGVNSPPAAVADSATMASAEAEKVSLFMAGSCSWVAWPPRGATYRGSATVS